MESGNLSGKSSVHKEQARVMLWCYPRTLSTVLTKCLSFIEDLEVWFEPFTYCDIANTVYRAETGKELPPEYSADNASEFAEAAEIVKRSQGVSSNIVPDRISYGSTKHRLESTESRLVLVKDMTTPFRNNRFFDYIPSGYQHVFLIRDPTSALHSYRRACIARDKPVDENLYDIVRDDVFVDAEEFIPSLHRLWTFIRETVDPDPMVIEADDLTANTGVILEKLCSWTGLPYSDTLLRWDASTAVFERYKACSDGLLVDVPAFFQAAATSSKFLVNTKKPLSHEDLSEDVKRLVDIAMPLYNEINKHKIKI